METPTLDQLSKLLASPKSVAINPGHIRFRRAAASSLLIFSDLLAITFAMMISVLLRNLILGGHSQIMDYIQILPAILPFFPLALFFRGLYPGFGIDIIQEIRSLTFTITIGFAIIAVATFLVKESLHYSRMVFLLSWLFSLAFVPLARAAIRKFFGAKSWWGIPVIIIGAGKAGEHVIKSLLKHKHIGLKPLVAVDDDFDRWGYIDGIPVVGGLDILPELSSKLKVDHSIIAMPSVPRNRQQDIIMKYSKYFEHTTVIPDLFGISSLWVSAKDIGGILGLEVQRKLLKISSVLSKRIFDIVIASILMIILSPFYMIISLLIKLDSKGSVFFKQKRMGINDSRFRIVKFRTMHIDAEDKLADLLNENEDLKAEYEMFHKLRNDPRMTRVGTFLRKYSLDELPQFWNVLKGDMSLIGPRAYMPWEKKKMNGMDDMILKVKPGISGLWQVTDRNNSSFEERNQIDVYYIRNWSMFLDVYILVRTIGVIITGQGE